MQANTIFRFTIGLTATVMSLSFLLLSMPKTSAAIPLGFSGFDDCKAKVATYPATEIKEYGQVRADKRIGSLDKYNLHIEKRYEGFDRSITKAAEAYKSKVGSEVPANLKEHKVNKDKLLAEVSATKAKVTTLKSELQGEDVSVLADKACQIIYATQVYNYFEGKMKAQHAIDGLYVMNTVNLLYSESAKAVYEKNKNSENAVSMQQEVAKLPDVKARVASIDALQPELDKINLQTIQRSADIPPAFKALAGKAEAVKKDVSKERSTISSISKKINSLVKKKSKSKKTSSSSSNDNNTISSTSSPVDSTSTDSSSSNSSGSGTAKPEPSTPKCKPNQEEVKSKCVSKCKTNQTRNAKGKCEKKAAAPTVQKTVSEPEARAACEGMYAGSIENGAINLYIKNNKLQKKVNDKDVRVYMNKEEKGNLIYACQLGYRDGFFDKVNKKRDPICLNEFTKKKKAPLQKFSCDIGYRAGESSARLQTESRPN